MESLASNNCQSDIALPTASQNSTANFCFSGGIDFVFNLRRYLVASAIPFSVKKFLERDDILARSISVLPRNISTSLERFTINLAYVSLWSYSNPNDFVGFTACLFKSAKICWLRFNPLSKKNTTDTFSF